METVAAVQIFRDEGMTETESGCAESISRHRLDARVVAVIKSALFES